jgi:hypothetical protein
MAKLKLCSGSLGIRHLYGMWSSEVSITLRPFYPVKKLRFSVGCQDFCRREKDLASAGIRTLHRPALLPSLYPGSAVNVVLVLDKTCEGGAKIVLFRV